MVQEEKVFKSYLTLFHNKKHFPGSENIMILTNGFFTIYLKKFGYNINEIAVTKKYKNIETNFRY